MTSDDRKKRPRTAFSASQIKALETEFERGKYLSVAKRTALAKQLHLTETQVIKLISRRISIWSIIRSVLSFQTSLHLQFSD